MEVNDQQEGATLHLRRSVLIPTTRIAPDQYAAFQRFARAADAAITRDVVVQL
jgi:hypothetical protein